MRYLILDCKCCRFRAPKIRFLAKSPTPKCPVCGGTKFSKEHAVIASTERVSASADDIRAAGWTVAVHNDYHLRGRNYTFWLFTCGNHSMKGEGISDRIALNQVRRKLGIPIK